MRIVEAPSGTTPVECATSFGSILDGLAGRLGAGWYLEATSSCDGTSILLVMNADEEADLTLTVTETPAGFVLEEMKADRLRRIGDCQTLDQVTSLLIRHVFKVPARLGFARIRSAAA